MECAAACSAPLNPSLSTAHLASLHVCTAGLAAYRFSAAHVPCLTLNMKWTVHKKQQQKQFLCKNPNLFSCCGYTFFVRNQFR